jgi:hypothetical protein
MGKRKDVSEFEKGLIMGSRLSGATIKKTMEISGKSKTTISKVYSKWLKDKKNYYK